MAIEPFQHRARRPGARCRGAGFTLLEVLVAAVLAFVVLAVVMRMISSSVKNFTTMDRQADLTQNQYQVLNKLVQDLMEAGADLPKADASVKAFRRDSIMLYTNPRAAYFPLTNAATASQIYVQNANPFFGLSSIRHFIGGSTVPQWATLSVSSIDTLKDTLKFGASVTWGKGDVFYDRDSIVYFRQPSLNQVLRKKSSGALDTLAENVTALSFRFFKDNGDSTVDWADMKTCSLCVTIRSAYDAGKTKRSCRRFFFRNRTKSSLGGV